MAENGKLRKELIINPVLCNRYATSSKEIKTHLESVGVSISTMTIRRRLYEQGIKPRRPVKQSRLIEKLRLAGLHFVRPHPYFTIEDWKKVVITV